MKPTAFAMTAILALSGCATITRGTNDTLVVESSPSGAQVQLSNGQQGQTPASFKLPRNEPVRVTFTKEGYESITATVTPKISGGGSAGMAGNVLVGGLPGVAVDAFSGAMYDLTPNPVFARLERVETN
jgi:hypothetical protein